MGFLHYSFFFYCMYFVFNLFQVVCVPFAFVIIAVCGGCQKVCHNRLCGLSHYSWQYLVL